MVELGEQQGKGSETQQQMFGQFSMLQNQQQMLMQQQAAGAQQLAMAQAQQQQLSSGRPPPGSGGPSLPPSGGPSLPPSPPLTPADPKADEPPMLLRWDVQLGMLVVAVLLGISVQDKMALTVAALMAVIVLAQLVTPRFVARVACVILISAGILINLDASTRGAAETLSFLDELESNRASIVVWQVLLGAWFALRPAAHCSRRTKLLVVGTFEALLLMAMHTRFQLTGERRVLWPLLPYVTLPFTAAFLCTLSVQGRATRVQAAAGVD